MYQYISGQDFAIVEGFVLARRRPLVVFKRHFLSFVTFVVFNTVSSAFLATMNAIHVVLKNAHLDFLYPPLARLA
jgi:hypothetical protein